MSFVKSSIISSLLVTLFIFFQPLSAYAQAGCCSNHGGVTGCNKSSNFLSCKDGTTSPTCACDGTTAKKDKSTKAAAVADTSAAGAADTSAKDAKAAKAAKAKEAKADKAAKAKEAKEEKAAKAKEAKAAKAGCCSGHGGVGKCDKKSGYQVCKDGTTSTTCMCGKKK